MGMKAAFLFGEGHKGNLEMEQMLLTVDTSLLYTALDE
jgi:hypothetical protein